MEGKESIGGFRLPEDAEEETVRGRLDRQVISDLDHAQMDEWTDDGGEG